MWTVTLSAHVAQSTSSHVVVVTAHIAPSVTGCRSRRGRLPCCARPRGAHVKLQGRLSFRDAVSRRAAEAIVERLQALGVGSDAVRVDGLTLVVATEVPDDEALRAPLRELAAAAWGGTLSCEVSTSAVPEVLYAGGPDAAGLRALGSLLPVAHSSRFRGELARVGGPGDPAQYRFDRKDCTVLVAYALSASHDKPDADDPRWVYGTPPGGIGLLAAQPAPSSRIMRRTEFFHVVNEGVADQRLDPWAAVHLAEGLTWAAETGCRWFAYMLEPLVIAGAGTAAALALAAQDAVAQSPASAQVGTADTIAATSLSPGSLTAPRPASAPVAPVAPAAPVAHVAPAAPVAPAAAAVPRAPTPPASAWHESATTGGYQEMLPSGNHRSAILRALSRNIGDDGLAVARRAAAYAQQSGALSDCLLELLAITNDLTGAPRSRGDALFAVAVLGVEQHVSLPEQAFAPLLDATLRSMTMNAERRPGFEGLLALAPRTAAYQALRASLGVA